MNTQQLIALLQSLDPSGTKHVVFQNQGDVINHGDEIDIIGGIATSSEVKLQSPKKP